MLYYGGSRTRGTRRIRGFERREGRGETHFEFHMSGMIQIVISIFDILFISHILPVL
jgi:hypothetical protein